MRRFIYILFVLTALTACDSEREIDIDRMDIKEKIVMYCMPCAGIDTTLIQISRSVAVTSASSMPDELENPVVNYSVNGVEQRVEYAEITVGSVPAGCYYVVGTLHEGDKVTVEASADGLPKASGTTTIPDSFPLKKLEFVWDATSENTLQFNIAMSGEPNEEYYAAHFVEYMKHSFSYEDEDDVKTVSSYEALYHLTMDVSGEPLLNNATGADEIFAVSNSYFSNMYIFTNRTLGNKDYTMHVKTSYWSGYQQDEDNYLYLSFKVYLYRLSPEMYLYLNSVNSINNNDLGHSGLASIRSHYTNVNGGVGIVCGCNIMESEWVDAPSTTLDPSTDLTSTELE